MQEIKKKKIIIVIYLRLHILCTKIFNEFGSSYFQLNILDLMCYCINIRPSWGWGSEVSNLMCDCIYIRPSLGWGSEGSGELTLLSHEAYYPISEFSKGSQDLPMFVLKIIAKHYQ